MDGFILLFLIGLAIWCFLPSSGRRAEFHGHGLTRGQVVRHERRHKRVLKRLDQRVARTKVYKTKHGWAGVTILKNSKEDRRRWAALSRDDQAAVFMAGAMGPEGDAGCGDDLAAVDRLSTRRRARRRARQLL